MNPLHRQTRTTKELHQKLLQNNSDYTKNPDLHIDLAAMLILLTGNPLSLNLQIVQSGNQIEISTGTDDKQIGRLAIYSDPIAGGTFVRPDVLPEYRRLGHGSLLYLAAARLVWLDKRELLHSNYHNLQLTQKAAGVWAEFITNGWAIEHAPNLYSIKENVVRSFVAAQILDTFLTHNLKIANYRNHPLAKEKLPTPQELRADIKSLRSLWLYNPAGK